MMHGQKTIKLSNICFVFLDNLRLKHLILSRIERDMIRNVYWSSCEVILVRV
jgi:hypothetical protein